MTNTADRTVRIDRAAIHRRIERLEISADLKSLLASLIDKTVVVAGKLVDLGARIVTFVFELAKAYPGVAFGVLAALVLSYLVGSIPAIGPVLAPVLTPILLIIGISLGALDDLTDAGMRHRLQGLSDNLRASGIA